MRIAILLLLIMGATAHAVEADNFNLRTNPLGWVIGPNARLDYKMTARWTFGPGFNYIDRKISGVKLNAFTTSLYLNYYFGEALTTGWLLDFGGKYGTYKAEVGDVNGGVDQLQIDNLALQTLIGYHWFWGHFNLCVAAGAEGNSAGHAALRDNQGDRVNSLPLPPLGFISEATVGVNF